MYHAQLRAFHAVASTGGFSRAAQHLRISQPAVSDHVRKLEDAFGVELFYRVSRRVELTGFGRELFARTERQFEAEAETLELLSRARGGDSGELRIGADSVVHALPILAQVRAASPAVSFKIVAGNSAQLVERLESFSIDFAIIGTAPAAAHISSRLLREDKLVAIACVDGPLSGKTAITVSDFASHPLVLREKGSATREIMDAELMARGLKLTGLIEVEGREAARETVAQGLGLGIVSEREHVSDPRIEAVPFSDWDPRMCEWLIWLRARERLQLVKRLIDHVDTGSWGAE